MTDQPRKPAGLADGTGGQFTFRPLKSKSSLFTQKFMRGGREQALYTGSSLSADGKSQFVMYRQGDRVFCTHTSLGVTPKRFVILDDLQSMIYEYRAIARRNPDDETISVKVNRYTIGSKDAPISIALQKLPLPQDELNLRGFEITDPETGDRISNIGMSIIDASEDPDIAEMASQARYGSLARMQAVLSDVGSEDASIVREQLLIDLDAAGLSDVVEEAKKSMWSAVVSRMIELDQSSSQEAVERVTDAAIATIAKNT